ncbi:MAG TPA: aminopeptidase [Candidatus Woesearchaeota archaeon]|nr:aminopeptidase [Candidatus Woesearchaeota archaeon]
MQPKLSFDRSSGWLRVKESKKKKIFDFSSEYLNFLNACKTERESVDFIKKEAEKKGFRNINGSRKLKSGDKVFYESNSKNIFLAVVGQPKINVVVSHLDSPRLDLKPLPLIEESGIAFLKTHYYGGIKKYQWLNIPLEMRGVVMSKGKKINVSIGEKDDLYFTITDLLPHLSQKQMEKKASEFVEGEDLNMIFGNMPSDSKKKVKESMLSLLNKKYGMIEEDFVSAELELVPAFKAKDLGLDRSMMGGYAHDDRSCSYALLRAVLDSSKPKPTSIALFVDKEEIGSEGNTSAGSMHFVNFLEMLKEKCSWKERINEILISGESISADVTSAFDPFKKDVFDVNNSNELSKGVSIEKYNGSGGKYYGNDASAEFFYRIRSLANKNKVIWQTGEIGKVDIGGGGTVAVFLAKLGINVIDAGIPVLGMHSPFEVISKLDLYETYRLYRVFLNEQ